MSLVSGVQAGDSCRRGKEYGLLRWGRLAETEELDAVLSDQLLRPQRCTRRLPKPNAVTRSDAA